MKHPNISINKLIKSRTANKIEESTVLNAFLKSFNNINIVYYLTISYDSCNYQIRNFNQCGIHSLTFMETGLQETMVIYVYI